MSLSEGGIRLASSQSQSSTAGQRPARKQSAQFSELARAAIMTNVQATTSPVTSPARATSPSTATFSTNTQQSHPAVLDAHAAYHASLMPPPKTIHSRPVTNGLKPSLHQTLPHSLGAALTDTPLPSQPTSPQIQPKGSISGSSTPNKARATTLDIPGLTKSKISPNGQIADRDVGAKLIIIMVGLPARGKSYLVKKIARYLNWLQHPTRIFNVGDRRRVAAGSLAPAQQQHQSIDGALRDSVRKMSLKNGTTVDSLDPVLPPAMLINGEPSPSMPISPLQMTGPVYPRLIERPTTPPESPGRMDQSASFFDPENAQAKKLREKVAHDTLDDLLQFVLGDGGSVGILDATNHTVERRQSMIDHIRKRDPTINFLFLESRCQDQNLLEANMRLKLSGPDYKDKDPVVAYEDFKNRVAQYEKLYQPLGDYEEERKMPYCSLIDVGRKMVSHNVKGFLSIQTVTYLMNFNLAPRQIWLTRHGESMDNVNGRIGGDSSLSPQGVKYARALTTFIGEQRTVWEHHQIEKQASTHFPPQPGDTTPPNPEVTSQMREERNFCVWTSMLNRSIETAANFDDEHYDIKQMRMLDELNSGSMNGMTYEEIKKKYPHEYEMRKQDKLHYRYPGQGGEGYLDIISRLRKVILEVERTTDHVLIVGHRSITRVLLAYFMGLKQEDISDLDIPLGVTYLLEPRPYGVDFKAYRWNPVTNEFHHEVDFKMRRATIPEA